MERAKATGAPTGAAQVCNHPNFPLRRHPAGQWYKTIRQKPIRTLVPHVAGETRRAMIQIAGRLTTRSGLERCGLSVGGAPAALRIRTNSQVFRGISYV
jgi:hypothetical protein